jgi:hypothetical protein
MAVISGTNLASDSLGTVTAGTTGSISPVSNSMILLAVYNNVAAGTPNIPTISGLGLTWNQVFTEVSSITTSRSSLFTAVGTVTPGAVVIDCSATQNRFVYSVEQFTNTLGVVQADMNSATGTQTGITVTLNPFSNPNNASYGFIRSSSTGEITTGSGFGTLSWGTANDSSTWNAEYKNTNDITVDWTWTSVSSNFIAIAAELQAASSGAFINNFV